MYNMKRLCTVLYMTDVCGCLWNSWWRTASSCPTSRSRSLKNKNKHKKKKKLTLFLFPGLRRVRSPPRDFYFKYNMWQDAGSRTTVAATNVCYQWATHILKKWLYQQYVLFIYCVVSVNFLQSEHFTPFSFFLILARFDRIFFFKSENISTQFFFIWARFDPIFFFKSVDFSTQFFVLCLNPAHFGPIF